MATHLLIQVNTSLLYAAEMFALTMMLTLVFSPVFSPENKVLKLQVFQNSNLRSFVTNMVTRSSTDPQIMSDLDLHWSHFGQK
jgi:hypothetical protein